MRLIFIKHSIFSLIRSLVIAIALVGSLYIILMFTALFRENTIQTNVSFHLEQSIAVALVAQ